MNITHRYEGGVKSAMIGGNNQYIVHISANNTLACVFLRKSNYPSEPLVHRTPDSEVFNIDEEAKINVINIIHRSDSKLLLFSSTGVNFLIFRIFTFIYL